MKNIKFKIRLFFVIYIFLLIPSNAVSENYKNIRVVFTSWFPYTYQENGGVTGIEIEIFNAVAESIYLKPEFKKYPWKRCLANLEYGDSDVLVSMLKTPEREQYTFYPDEHISTSKTIFFTTMKKNISYDGSFLSLKGYSIGTIMGFSYGEAFDKADYLKKDDVLDVQKLIKKIVSGRNDLGAENYAVVSAYAKKMGVWEKLKFCEPPIHTQKLYVGFSKKNGLKELCVNFSNALREFKKTDKYKSILTSYGLSQDQ